MKRWLLLWAALAGPLYGQLQISTINNAGETVVTSYADLGRISTNDSLDTRFRLRNLGNGAVTLQTLRVAGSGFSLSGNASLPYIIAPTANYDFTVRFVPGTAGTYSANLLVNNTSVILSATALAVAAFGPLPNGQFTPLAAASTTDFGQIEKGATSTQHFALVNPNAAPVSVSALTVTGSCFRLVMPLSLPLTLEPKAQVPVDVSCTPTGYGIQQGQVQVDQRVFALTAYAPVPSFPRPAVQILSSAVASGQQIRVAVQLAAASKVAGTGDLRVEFQPSVPKVLDDQAIQFVSSGTRLLPFTVQPSDTKGTFASGPEALLQTGTTAGSLVFTARLGTYSEQFTVPLPAANPVIDSAQATRNGTSVEVTLNAFDNTHNAGIMTFTFYDQAGSPVTPGAIKLDLTPDFQRYFTASTAGGLFSLKAVFPLYGPASQIVAADVEVFNSNGSTRTGRLRF